MVLHRSFDEVLYPVDVRGECRDYYTPFGIVEYLVDGPSDDCFRRCETVSHDIRAVAEQNVHSLITQLREASEVDDLAVERRVVDLEVSRMEYVPARELYRVRQRVCDAVICLYGFNSEASDIEDIARFYNMCLCCQKVFFELVVDETHGQR